MNVYSYRLKIHSANRPAPDGLAGRVIFVQPTHHGPNILVAICGVNVPSGIHRTGPAGRVYPKHLTLSVITLDVGGQAMFFRLKGP
jgi:hypothetical protein